MRSKVCMCLIIIIFTYNNLCAQPTGENRAVRLCLSFLTSNNDTIDFRIQSKNNFRLFSLDDNYKVRVYEQSYNRIVHNEKEYYQILNEVNRKKEDSISIINWKVSYIRDIIHEIGLSSGAIHNLYRSYCTFYYPSIKPAGDYRNHPMNDLIVYFEYRNKIMRVCYKLYSAKGLFEGGSDVFMEIPFQEGSFEVTDPENPQLIRIKEEE